jgi:hypothetical protein
MSKVDYTNREIDGHFLTIKESLIRIEAQTIKTNGRVNRLERNILIIACILGTVILLKFPQVISAVKLFI